MRKLLFIVSLFLAIAACAQTPRRQLVHRDTALVLDTTKLTHAAALTHDTIFEDQAILIDSWRPNPMKAVWMGALFPGLGQIYNRSYWKLPIVYGGFMGCIYAITWNTTMYTEYKQAYIDIYNDDVLSDDPSRSYNAILPKGYTVAMMGGKSAYTTTLNNKQTLYRRYRDISIVATVAVYVLSLVDAYVDAQLFDFDISPDLSLNVEPQLYHDLQHNRSAEIKLAFQF